MTRAGSPTPSAERGPLGAGEGAGPARRALTVARALAAPLRRPRPPADPPPVSVVTATYNYSSVLRHAIASVRAQDYPRWEMIVVGDACTDDSPEVVASFGDGRLRWHNRAENAGSQSLPNNDGIAMARGRFIAYLGHDDVWAPDHLSRLVATVLRTRADVAFSLAEVLGPPGSGLRTLSGTTPRGGYAGGHLPPSSVLHRRELAAEIGGWRDYREIWDPPDTDFLQRAARAGNRFACTWALTAFKLPSAMRRNSYVDRPSWEQAELARRIASERWFTARELGRVVIAHARGSRAEWEAAGATPGRGTERGAQVKEARRIRGLDPP